MNKCELDIEVFASRWNAINQLSDSCIVKNIKRLCKGKGICLKQKSITKITPGSDLTNRNKSNSNLDEVLFETFNSIYEIIYQADAYYK